MTEWLDQHVLYWHWLVFGMLLAVSEIFMPAFFMLWLGISAVVVGVVLYFMPLAFSTQLLIWTVLSVLCLVAWFRFVSPMIKTRSLSGMALEELVGKSGTVLDYNAGQQKGRIRFPAPLLGDDEWDFIAEEAFKPGDRAVVREIVGNRLRVGKA